MQAQDQMTKGDLASATRTVELAMQKDPTLWLTYYMRARLLMRERKYGQAIEDCNWVLRNTRNSLKLRCFVRRRRPT
jgi:Tfp pilus assembly protein PilF